MNKLEKLYNELLQREKNLKTNTEEVSDGISEEVHKLDEVQHLIVRVKQLILESKNEPPVYQIGDLKGDPKASSKLFAVIHLDEDDLSGCNTAFYAANTPDEVGDMLVAEEYDERNFIIEEVGEKK